jgi:hypothetical protein
MITNAEADILLHTSSNGRYVSNEPLAIDLGARGLLYDHGPQVLAGWTHYLVTTPAGRQALSEWKAAQPKPNPKRRPRSEQFDSWRNYCEAMNRISFPDFLQQIWPHRKQYF